jgi:hypothetical protein
MHNIFFPDQADSFCKLYESLYDSNKKRAINPKSIVLAFTGLPYHRRALSASCSAFRSMLVMERVSAWHHPAQVLVLGVQWAWQVGPACL